MRRLLLLRHAQAVPAIGRDDYGRVLSPAGRAEAEAIGALIVERGLIPDLVVASSANRTRETADIVVGRFARAARRASEHAIYEASRPLIEALILRMPADAASVMIVGHNPGMADVANHMAREGPELELRRMASRFPTAALAVLEFDGEAWAQALPRTARLAAFVALGDGLG